MSERWWVVLANGGLVWVPSKMAALGLIKVYPADKQMSMDYFGEQIEDGEPEIPF